MAENVFECSLESETDVPNDDQVLVRAAQEDPEAAGRLYDKYYSRIFGYIYRCTLDQTTTEDLTSNVFLAAFRHLGRYRWRQIPFRAWLYRIATNEVRMYYRTRRRSQCLGEEVEADVPAASTGPAAEEEYRLLHAALVELPPKYRTVIVLRYFEDRPIAEIAAITRTREGTVKSQLHRGLCRLQEVLLQRGVLPE
jgi:RNA polymerase sigma-70 factor, ECF subfamily